MGSAKVAGAIARLRELSAALRSAPEAMARAAVKVEPLIHGMAAGVLRRHTDTGQAAATLVVARSGGSISMTSQAYLQAAWWPFRRGRVPMAIVKAASRAYAAEVLALLGHGAAPAQLAAAEVEAEGIAATRAKAAKAKISRKARAGR